MDSSEATMAYRLNQWSQLIQERSRSGLKVKDWCMQNNISRDQYYFWQRKLRKLAAAELETEKGALKPVEWVKVSPLSDGAYKPVASERTIESSGLTVEAAGYRLHVKPSTDMNLLARVCRALVAL